MPHGPTDPALIGAMAEALLAQAAEALVDSSNGAFEKTWVTYANPVDDCKNALSVYVGAIQPFFGAFVSQPRGGGLPPQVGLATQVPFYVRLLRCIQAGKGNNPTPAPAVQQADALGLLEDGWRLWRTLTQRWKDSTLFDPAYQMEQSNVVLDNLNPLPATGGAAGYQWKITVQVDEKRYVTGCG